MTGRIPRAAILVTGDEVLGGRVSERNAAHLARFLADRGVAVERTLIVGDRLADLRGALRSLLDTGVDLVCTSGGLGPTADDLTMEAVARETGRQPAVDEEALALVRRRSAGIGPTDLVSESDLDRMRRKQATLPEGAVVLPPVGTAPGAALRHGRTLIVVLPGPPAELAPMWERAATEGPLADLLATAPGRRTRTLRLWWVFEAELMAVLGSLPSGDLGRLGTYTRDGELEIVVPEDLADAVTELLEAAFGDALFARDETTVDDIVAGRLETRGDRLAVAESCTGGGLGARITARAGASRWFVGGVIAYANTVKEHVLGVPAAVLAGDGAVSEAAALAMADGVRRVTGAEWGVAITGIAGPDGGTAAKPVGLVWIAVSGPSGTTATEHRFRSRDRATIRRRAAIAAMHHLRIAITAV